MTLSLREISQIAGSLELTAEAYKEIAQSGTYGARSLYITAVAGIYRPAREHLRREDSISQMIGCAGMEAFAKALDSYRLIYQADGDGAMALLCLHSIGTAVGWCGREDEQILKNEAVWANCQDEDFSDEDREFLRGKSMAALLEHNFDEFVSTENLLEKDLLEFVNNLFDRKAPDAPGRALWLARRMLKDTGIPIHENTQARKLIQLACAATEFGKPDQIDAAEALFKELYQE